MAQEKYIKTLITTPTSGTTHGNQLRQNFEDIEKALGGITTEEFTGEIENTASVFDSGVFEVVDGPLKLEKYNGNTVANSVNNGGFSDGTNGWSQSGGINSVVNNILSNSGNGTSGTVQLLNTPSPIPFVTGDKFFVCYKLRVTNADCISIKHRVANFSSAGTITKNSITPVENQWETLCFIDTTTASSGSFYISTQHIYSDATTANGKTMEVDGVYGVSYIKMTGMYYENYTESQMLELVKNGYIEGMQGTGDKKISSRDSLGVVKDSKYVNGGNRTLTTVDTYENGVNTQNVSVKTAIATATAINTTNFPEAKLNGEYVLLQDDKIVMTGIIDGSDTTTDAGTIIYELETPVTTIQKQSNMTAYEAGDFIVENKFTHIEYYGEGIDLASYGYSNLTIASAFLITSDSNINGYQELDPAEFVVTGTVITNPSLNDTDLVFLEPEYADGRTQITTIYNYPMNLGGTISTTVEKVTENGKNIEYLNKEISRLQKENTPIVANLSINAPDALNITPGTPLSVSNIDVNFIRGFNYTGGSLVWDEDYDIYVKVDGAISCISSTNNATVTISFGNKGIVATSTEIDRKISTGADVGALPVAGGFVLTKGDYLDFFVDVDVASIITITKGNFTIHKLVSL